MAKSASELLGGLGGETTNKVGTLESIFSGVVSGLISIPKGFFSLGATLIDLGAGTNEAAKVEAFFDNLTNFDEKAEATTAGKITEVLVNVGIPGGVAFKAGQKAAMQAMRAKNANVYFKPSKELVETAQGVAKQNTILTKVGARKKFLTGAGYGGVAEGVFIGDVEQVGTFGDLLGGPTAINREEDKNDPLRKLINRVKFGTEGALFTGVLGGIGLTARKLADRTDSLAKSNDSIDKFLYFIATGLRARGKKDPKFFDQERLQVGLRSGDLVGARNIVKELEKDVDAIFPSYREASTAQGKVNREKLLSQIDDVLLSGTPKMDDAGKVTFGSVDNELKTNLRNTIFDLAPNATIASKSADDIITRISQVRNKWGQLFEVLGGTSSAKDFIQFKNLFGKKTKDWLGATYELFTNKPLGPFLGYQPTRQNIKNTMDLFVNTSKENRTRAINSFIKQGLTEEEAFKKAPRVITDLEAESYVNDIIATARLPKSFRMDRPSDPIFNIPDFFVGKTAMQDASSFNGIANLGQFNNRIKTKYADGKMRTDKQVFQELLGKTKNPMQTILGGTGRLSLITRRNEFFDNIVKESDKLPPAKQIFARSRDEANAKFGGDVDGFEQIKIDPGKAIDVGSGNPLNNLFARKPIVDALKLTGDSLEQASAFTRLYENLILYPKATSQMAKTILSPITHARNFISAGAFAAANGIIPLADPAIIKNAYQALQTPLKGTRIQNEFYEKLLRLGVVNSNVRLGDLTRLLEDVNFGETFTSNQGLASLLRPLSKLKQVSQDLYTAEDDFWKIYSWASEKDRIGKAFLDKGIKQGDEFIDAAGNTVKLTDDYLEQQAADIVKNNIPNYDFVGSFIKDLRRFPVGNFVSFPAEIIRTGTNIVRRGLREINETISITDGAGKVIKTVKPFESIGYTRLFGFGATTVAVPYAVSEMFKALYNVTSEEMEALRRYVPDWSKNSTLIPIKGKNGDLKYVDFSHSNAYDTLTRPIQSIINRVNAGEKDQDGMMDDFLAGVFTATKELGEPFVSESIWTEAAADILVRQGRTRSGSRIFNSLDTPGDKGSAIFKHLVNSQMPFSKDQLVRVFKAGLNEVDVIEKGKFDKYGQTFELDDELAGFLGFRAVPVNPERSLKFKIADYQKGVRDSRSLFTARSLRGGPIDPQEIVQNYINANRALFGVRSDFQKDLDGAIVLGMNPSNVRNQVTERISDVDYNTIQSDLFRPLAISDNVIAAFAENAANIGVSNPFSVAFPAITQIQAELRSIPLTQANFPSIENPLLQPITTQLGLGTTTNTGSILPNLSTGSSLNKLTNQQKIDILFKN